MADDKRQQILSATLELVARKGFHGTPASQIAARAGVGVGTIYRYFSDKDELIHALFAEVRQGMRARIFADVHEIDDLQQRFFIAFTRMLREFIRNPLEFRFIEQYHFSPYSSCHDEDAEINKDDEYIRLFRELHAAGLIKDLPRMVLKSLTFGPLVALAREHESRPFPIDDTMVEATVQACWDAIKSSPSAT